MASADVELAAVCTTRPESAEAARKAFGAKLAFSDYREMVCSPQVDAVVVVVRVPSHHAPTLAAIEAGKPVYTEWPLGRNTAEAEDLHARALAKGVPTAVGLQSRVSPGLLFAKELLETGYVGKVLACNVVTFRDGSPNKPSKLNWMADSTNGANTFTIATGHVVDAMRLVAGDFTRVSGLLSTQLTQWSDPETGKVTEVTSPDNILITGELTGGAVASVHVGAVPWAGPGYRMEIFGTDGTVIVTGQVSSQRGPMLRVQGAHKSKVLQDLEIPARFAFVPADFPQGDPYNVGQMYALFARYVRTGKAPAQLPTFAAALDLHRLLDTVRHASTTGKVQSMA